MDSHNIMFVVLAVIIALSSIATVVTKSIIRAATYLLFVLLGTAGLYFLMGYTFLGSVQTMVYAGGIIVLYVFSILLTSGQQEALNKSSRVKLWASLCLSLLGFVVLAVVICTYCYGIAPLGAPVENVTNAVAPLTGDTTFAPLSIHYIGRMMLSTDHGGYLLPFEAVSVLLLACIVGGLIIARKR